MATIVIQKRMKISYIMVQYFTNDHSADWYDFWLVYESVFQYGLYLKWQIESRQADIEQSYIPAVRALEQH